MPDRINERAPLFRFWFVRAVQSASFQVRLKAVTHFRPERARFSPGVSGLRTSICGGIAERTPSIQTFSVASRRLRAEWKLSQEALAYECGINRTYLSAVEAFGTNVSIDNIARIANVQRVWKLLRDG
jgi:DNA-binding XRE family transcriptional regulator